MRHASPAAGRLTVLGSTQAPPAGAIENKHLAEVCTQCNGVAGAATELFGTVAGQPCCVMLNGRTDLRAGNPVALRADLSKVLVFDRASGRRLR
jgi:hypothetical protein